MSEKPTPLPGCRDSSWEEAIDTASGAAAGFWSSVLESLRGTSQDFTQGRLSRAILLLAVPMVLEMVMEALFAVVDMWFVADLGQAAVATVGLTESLIILVYTVAIGLSMAVTATVARRIGEKRPDQAAEVAQQAILLGAVIAAIIAVGGVVFAPALLGFMNADAEVIGIGSNYARVLFGSNVVILLLFLNNAVFRGAGDATMAMRALWVANGLNLILDPCLIRGLGPFPEMGLTGAAVATSIGRGTGVAFQLWILLRGRGRISLAGRPWRWNGAVMANLLRLSRGGVGQFLVSSASWVFLVRLVAGFSAAAAAGYTLAIRICFVAFLPAWGLSNAAATLVGQNLGAGRPARAERSVWLTGSYNMAFLGAVTVMFVGFPSFLVGLFPVRAEDQEMVAFATSCLRIISYGYVFYAWEMVMVQAFNGAGDTMTPTLINLGCFWCFQLPLAWLLSHTLGWGPAGVFWAVAISYSFAALVGMVLFRRGRWKTRVV